MYNGRLKFIFVNRQNNEYIYCDSARMGRIIYLRLYINKIQNNHLLLRTIKRGNI